MITRSHRFHGFNSLRHVYAHGRTVRSPLVAVKSELNPRRAAYRAAVVVSRKVHKSAVVRNRIRRRIYEIVRRHEAAVTQPYDLVITVFSEEVATMEATELEKMLMELLEKTAVFGPPQMAPPKGHARENTRSHGIVERMNQTNQTTPKEKS